MSHDRYFLDKVVDRVVEVAERGFVSFEGNFSEYLGGARPVTAPRTGRGWRRVRTQRERQPREGGAAVATVEPKVAALQEHIAEGEREAADLERRVSDAFTRGDHREGTRVSRLLREHRARLDKLYDAL